MPLLPRGAGSDPLVYLLRAANLLALQVLASRGVGSPMWRDWCAPRQGAARSSTHGTEKRRRPDAGGPGGGSDRLGRT